MPAIDDKELFIVKKDISGGMDNRLHGNDLPDNEAVSLVNVDLGTPGKRSKRPGLTLLEDLGANPGLGLFGFEPDGGTNLLVAVEGTTLYTSPVSSGFTARKANFTSGLLTTILKIGESGLGDVFVAGNGTDNWFRFDPADLGNPQDLGNTANSPPLSTVGLWFRNRFWILDANALYWSDAFDDDYSGAFDRTTNFYRMPVGTERALLGLREEGIIALGQDAVWGIDPTNTPAATDKPVKILDIGCSNGRTAAQVGDDVFFLAPDGVRGVFRSQQDKLQQGASYPLSYRLKEEFASINWAQISKASAVYFDNKYFISLPVDASGTCNEVWVYFPASAGWMVISGWNVAGWSKIKINGEERLYAIDSIDGKVYQAWKGFSDNGTAISFTEESRKEDFKQHLVKKVGGVLKVRAVASGDYDLNVYTKVDDGEYQLLGTINLAGNAPTLPVSLPFSLAETNTLEEQFHLDSFGEFYELQTKLEHAELNGSDEITILETNITTYPTMYQSE